MNQFYTKIQPGLPRFESNHRIVIGYSRREDGGMSLKRGDEQECLARRERFFRSFDRKLERTVWGDLVHGTNVAIITEEDCGRGASAQTDAIPHTDGMWTTVPDLLLCTTHADCLALYFQAGSHPAVGVAHCGWRGIVGGLPGVMIEHAVRDFGINRSEIQIGIGPGIRIECFEIGEEILDRFPSEAVSQKGNKWFVDLPAVVKLDLQKAGIALNQIEDSGICSNCTPIYSSYRRDRSEVAPAVAFIGLRTVRQN